VNAGALAVRVVAPLVLVAEAALLVEAVVLVLGEVLLEVDVEELAGAGALETDTVFVPPPQPTRAIAANSASIASVATLLLTTSGYSPRLLHLLPSQCPQASATWPPQQRALWCLSSVPPQGPRPNALAWRPPHMPWPRLGFPARGNPAKHY
jgi:hypothetical protein